MVLTLSLQIRDFLQHLCNAVVLVQHLQKYAASWAKGDKSKRQVVASKLPKPVWMTSRGMSRTELGKKGKSWGSRKRGSPLELCHRTTCW